VEKRARSNPCRRGRGDAHGLVEALAGCSAKIENKDANGVALYPGWSLVALKYLYEERKIAAAGHETTDTDLGTATSKDDYSRETYILSTNHLSD
jgi:kynurenine formamidase